MMTSIGVLTTLYRLAASTKFMGKLRRKPSKRRSSASIEVEAWQQRCYELTRENERLEIRAREAYAQLCQLRSIAGNINGRIGYMVGTFIPEQTVEKLKRNPQLADEFKRTVLDTVMQSVLGGLLYRKENGKCVAMIFLPHGEKFDKRTALQVFDCEGKHTLEIPQKLRDEIDDALERQRRDERKLLGY